MSVEDDIKSIEEVGNKFKEYDSIKTLEKSVILYVTSSVVIHSVISTDYFGSCDFILNCMVDFY